MKRKRGEERRVEERRHRKLDVFLGTHDNICWYMRELFTLYPGKEPPKRTRNSFLHSHRDANTASTDLEKIDRLPTQRIVVKTLRMFPLIGKDSYAWAEH